MWQTVLESMVIILVRLDLLWGSISFLLMLIVTFLVFAVTVPAFLESSHTAVII